MRVIVLIFVLISFVNCKKNTAKVVTTSTGLVAKNAMVVSAREEASNIGVDIMKHGGNAFDAMVATELALAVSYPYAGNVAGGGFMVYRTKEGKVGTLDFREKAPLAARETMYLDSLGNVIDRKSLDGALAVAVPGTIAGLWETHKKLGTLSWKELVQPAIELAKNGIIITKKQENHIQKYRKSFQKVNTKKIVFDDNWKEGDRFKFPELAKTLEIIRDKGKDGFYKGEVAKKISSFIQSNGGIITLEDLEKYKVAWRKPIQFQYKDFTINTMSLPSSGGIVLGQVLKTLEHYNLDTLEHNQSQYIQLITEIERRAYADRAHFLGDLDFVNSPVDSLLDTNYLLSRMNNFSWEQATSSSDVSHGNLSVFESDETTHYSIVDALGNAVAVTTTINGAYGSKLFHSELGFFYNNEMDDFSIKPGSPNLFGLIGGEANKIEAEKRMLSSMTPTIVEQNGELFMVLGSPGGSTIITSVLQTILNTTQFSMGMQEAVSKARFHHQWLPDEIRIEPNGFDSIVIQNLISLNYNIQEKESVVIGKVDAIKKLPNGYLEAGADPRGDDTAAGY